MKDRSIRRHHEQRRKAKAKKLLKLIGFEGFTPAHVGLYANTPKPCSCAMCSKSGLKGKDKLSMRDKRAVVATGKRLRDSA
jgi:hypothetical protein